MGLLLTYLLSHSILKQAHKEVYHSPGHRDQGGSSCALHPDSFHGTQGDWDPGSRDGWQWGIKGYHISIVSYFHTVLVRARKYIYLRKLPNSFFFLLQELQLILRMSEIINEC